MKKNLKGLRQEIDSINISILEMLNKRAGLLREVVELKDEEDIQFFDAEREAEMTEYILQNNKGPLYNELVKQVFAAIFSTSLKFMGKSREKKLLISSASPETYPTIQKMFKIEGDNPVIIAGPCAVEKLDYLEKVAEFLKARGIKFMRGGAYKPRTSPYDFQGLRADGLRMLRDVAKRYDLITVSEVVDPRDVELVAQHIDVLQVGARNMHNYELLKEIGQTRHPVVLKRGMSSTISEFMFAAEYIVLRGNKNVIMCERGIRTYETKTRNTLDISSIPIVKKETNLPVIADVSHSLGRKDIVNSIAGAVLAAGADGIMVEVHPFPELALSDSKQQLSMDEFDKMLKHLEKHNNYVIG